MQDTTISLCMIVKNEERVLARCLDSVADLVDEIIIVDTGSTDATKEIAARYTEQIYDLSGRMILRQPVIFPFLRQAWITSMRRMRTRS